MSCIRFAKFLFWAVGGDVGEVCRQRRADRVLAVEDDATMLVVRIESTEAVSAFPSSDE